MTLEEADTMGREGGREGGGGGGGEGGGGGGGGGERGEGGEGGKEGGREGGLACVPLARRMILSSMSVIFMHMTMS